MKNRIIALMVGMILLVSSIHAQALVFITSPNGGEVFEWDSTHTITWTFAPPPNWPYDCYLFLSTDGGSTFPDSINSSGMGDTFCLWTIPHVVSTTCRVLIQVDSMGVSICEDVSDSNFSIVQSGIEEDYCESSTPFKFSIFPNPFSTATSILLSGIGQRAERIELHIYDVSGRRVRELLLPTPYSILHTGITWDGRDDAGKVLPPGIYFLKLNGKPVGKVVKVR